MLCWRWGLWRQAISNFPTGFNVADFVLPWDAGTSQLVSGFLTRGIYPCIIVELWCVHEEECSELLIPPSC